MARTPNGDPATIRGGHQSPDGPGRTWLCERRFLHSLAQWVFPALAAKKDPLKGSSVGTGALFEILNNKPMQGSRAFFVRAVDTVSFSQTKVPVQGILAFSLSGRASSFSGVLSRGCPEQTPKAFIHLSIRNRGLRPRRSMLERFSLCSRRTSMMFQLWKLSASSRENPSQLLLSPWQ